MPREMFLTVGTGRDRRDIAQALAKSIRHHRPDRVWLLTSVKTEDETVPVLREALGPSSPRLETRVLEDPDDVETCYRQAQEWIEAQIAAGADPRDMVVDYTSGTKAMSAGLFAAAVGLGVETISYVAGRRDEAGRVIPGMERFTSFTPHLIFAQRELERAVWLFDRCRFEEAAHLATGAGTCGDSRLAARAQVLARLAEAFGAWDRFDHARAFQGLDAVGDDARLEMWPVRDAVERAKQFLFRAKANAYCAERLADLAGNARRRFAEGKYDDAVARCYRAFEYLAQMRQAALGLDPIELRWDAVSPKLPTEFRDVWRARMDAKGRMFLGLRNDYELLRDLGDSLGAAFCGAYAEKDSPLRKRLEQRNSSILAHGTSPVAQDAAAELLHTLEGFARGETPRWDSLVAAATFPQLAADGMTSTE